MTFLAIIRVTADADGIFTDIQIFLTDTNIPIGNCFGLATDGYNG